MSTREVPKKRRGTNQNFATHVLVFQTLFVTPLLHTSNFLIQFFWKHSTRMFDMTFCRSYYTKLFFGKVHWKLIILFFIQKVTISVKQRPRRIFWGLQAVPISPGLTWCFCLDHFDRGNTTLRIGIPK